MVALSYLRFPHLSGDTVVFVAEDDVWTAPLAGGRATRLTADGVPARNPRFSPDGALVAWSSTKDGAPEIRVAEADGGAARRVTFWGDLRTRLAGWTPDGRVVATSATRRHTSAHTWAYAVPAFGGRPHELPYGPVSAVSYRGVGVLIGRTMARDMAWWKRYRGGTAGKIWWDPAGAGAFTRILADLDGQLDAPMLVGDRIAFLSDHEDWGNVYSVDAAGGDLRRHTDHGLPGAPEFYARHASTDGERIVYEAAGELYLLDSLDGTARRLDIRLGGPRTGREPHRVPTARWLGGAVPDTTGRSSVVTVRGTVHRLTHRDGPARTLLAEQGVRARMAQPLGGDRAIWVDDHTGEDAVAISPLDPHAAGAPDLVRYADGQVGRVLELAAAPNGTLAALATHDNRLLLLDTATGAVREPARGAAGEIAGLAFSPDSRWLAYEDPVEPGLSRIMLVDLRDDSLVAVTEPRFVDTDPVFTTDGRYLAFLSRRSFDPIYDEHSFDLTFPASWRPFLVPLAARTPSPFGAGPDGRPTSGEDEDPEDPPAIEESESEAAEEKPAAKADEDGPPETVVDVEGLVDRVVPIPVAEGRYRGLGAAKDCLLWLSVPVTGVLGDGRADGEDPHPVLERFDLKKRKVDAIAEPAHGYAVSGDGARLVVRESRTLRVLRSDRTGSAAPSDSDGDEFEIDVRRISVTIDPAAEWRQMFDEAGRLMRDHYWIEDMAGVDWAAELERYRPLVDAVGSTDDLVDLLYELQGELGSSHAYVVGRGGGGDFGGRPGFLGADLEPSGGEWRVARVLPPETSAPDARSPFTEPGVDVRAGDVLLEVAGRRVDPELGPNPLLLGRAETLTELTVRKTSGEIRRVVVRPLAGEQNLRYHDWVAGRRAFVADRSAGRLGYLHVPDMVASGWAQLHRDFAREARREGLVLDVRDNSGGHTSQLVIEKLARKVIGWDVVRHAAPATYPEGAPRGPIVLVADEHAGSDGDIVTAAFKRMGLGPVVGVRTWGGVIGIDSRYSLVDGTRVTQPRYSFWFDDVHWSVENHGVDPDVEVVTTPQDWVAGRDPQLETAVDLALEALERTPAVTPPDPGTRPSRAKRPLPPRP
ncbi:S41 family peptidase [Pseudonocardia xishanensis]|uniref:Tricorn protease homolog n=1 Tax=Pseudonocardia xishanensis TaxID=630995 RepID=A0ABP8S5E9_9PSEU